MEENVFNLCAIYTYLPGIYPEERNHGLNAGQSFTLCMCACNINAAYRNPLSPGDHSSFLLDLPPGLGIFTWDSRDICILLQWPNSFDQWRMILDDFSEREVCTLLMDQQFIGLTAFTKIQSVNEMPDPKFIILYWGYLCCKNQRVLPLSKHCRPVWNNSSPECGEWPDWCYGKHWYLWLPF